MTELLKSFCELHKGYYNKLIIEFETNEIIITFDNGFYNYMDSKIIIVDIFLNEIVKMICPLAFLQFKSVLLINEKI